MNATVAKVIADTANQDPDRIIFTNLIEQITVAAEGGAYATTYNSTLPTFVSTRLTQLNYTLTVTGFITIISWS